MFAPTQPAGPPPFPDRTPGPLLLVGGFGGGPRALQPLLRRLRAAGYDAEIADTGLGLDHGERSVRRLLALVERRAGAAGIPVTLVAHSRGGQFGRVAACRRPDLVAHLLTMASPLTSLFGVSLPALMAVATTAVRDTFGAPGRLTLGCLRGACCAPFRRDLAAPFPPGVAFTSLYSRGDLVVPWRTSLDPAARHVEVRATHDTILTDPRIHDLVVEHLAAATAGADDSPPRTVV